MSRSCYVVALVAVGFLLALAMPQAQQATQSAPTYTAAQAAAGKTAYDTSCASCHGGNLDDGALAPALKGVAFVQKYGGKSVENLFTKVATMPPASPNSLGAAATARVVAYLLQANAIVAGTTELPTDQAALARMTIPVGGFSVTSFSPYAPALPAVKRANPLDAFTPISDAQLVEPAAQDWLTWRRSYDAQGFSPLTQITPRNVAGLRVAWSWTLPPGSSESTPLVHDGVMFVQGANDRVQALDARTGDLLWQYERRLPEGVARQLQARPGAARQPALHGHVGRARHRARREDRQARVGADDRRPEGARADRRRPAGGQGQGDDRHRRHGRGRQAGRARDRRTRRRHRARRVARPHHRAAGHARRRQLERHAAAAAQRRVGVDARQLRSAAAASPTSAPAIPTTPARCEAEHGSPGVTNDALYTDSTLAIDPDTGTVKWHFQHHPNDQWDLDWAFERQLARLPVNGENRTVMFTAGKIGIYDALDAKSGQYLFSIDLGLTTW